LFLLFANGGKFAAGIVDIDRNLPPVSTTPAELVTKFPVGVVDTGGKFAAGFVDTSGAPRLANISENF
jgi:hypothetical protein